MLIVFGGDLVSGEVTTGVAGVGMSSLARLVLVDCSSDCCGDLIESFAMGTSTEGVPGWGGRVRVTPTALFDVASGANRSRRRLRISAGSRGASTTSGGGAVSLVSVAGVWAFVAASGSCDASIRQRL